MEQGTSVILRLRPLVGKEMENAWDIDESTVEVLPTKRAFTEEGSVFEFPQIVKQDQTTLELFEKYLPQISENVVDGINSTLLAYGESSAGKTFTMFGSNAEQGVIELILTEIFDKVKGTPFHVKMQFVELYNEVLVDLLSATKKEPAIREDEGQILLENVEEPKVTSYEDCLRLMEEGEKNRTTSETNLNEQSSRSHAILRLVLEESDLPSLPTKRKTFRVNKSSVLTLVDLAGSEKQSKTNAQGLRLNEANSINKSLLTLGVVINALATKQEFVPYRDSKLTRLLQNSLGGNAISYIIGCISPAQEHIDESINTMRFCERAMKVDNKAKVNEFYTDAEKLERAIQQNKLLKEKIKELEEEVGIYSTSVANMTNLSISELDQSETSRSSISELSIDQLNEPVEKAVGIATGVKEADLEHEIVELEKLVELKDQESQKHLEQLREQIEDNTTDEILLVTQKYQEDFDEQQELDERRIDDLLIMVDTLQRQLNVYLEVEMVNHSVQISDEQKANLETFAEVGESLLKFCASEIATQKDTSGIEISCQNDMPSLYECGEEAAYEMSNKSTAYSEIGVGHTSVQAEPYLEDAEMEAGLTECCPLEMLVSQDLFSTENEEVIETDHAQYENISVEACQSMNEEHIETSVILGTDVSNLAVPSAEIKEMQTSTHQRDEGTFKSINRVVNEMQTSVLSVNDFNAQTTQPLSASCQCSQESLKEEGNETPPIATVCCLGADLELFSAGQSCDEQLYSSNMTTCLLNSAKSVKPNKPLLHSSPLRRMQREEAEFEADATVDQVFAHFLQETCEFGYNTALKATRPPEALISTMGANLTETVALTPTIGMQKGAFETPAEIETSRGGDLVSGCAQTEELGISCAVEADSAVSAADESVEFIGNNQSFGGQAVDICDEEDAMAYFNGDKMPVAIQTSYTTADSDKSAFWIGDSRDAGCSASVTYCVEDKRVQTPGDASDAAAQTDVVESAAQGVEALEVGESSAETGQMELMEQAMQCGMICTSEMQTDGAFLLTASVETQTEAFGCCNCALLEKQLRSEVAAERHQFEANSDEIMLQKQQNEGLQRFIAELEARFAEIQSENERIRADVQRLEVEKQELLRAYEGASGELSALEPPITSSFSMQTELNEISRSIQVYTSMVLSELNSSLTVDNSAHIADAATEMTIARVAGEDDYKQRYLELEATFNRLITDSREKIQLVMDNAKKREEHLLEKVKEQLGEMKKYKDIVIKMQEKSLLSQKMQMEEQMAGSELPKAPE